MKNVTLRFHENESKLHRASVEVIINTSNEIAFVIYGEDGELESAVSLELDTAMALFLHLSECIDELIKYEGL